MLRTEAWTDLIFSVLINHIEFEDRFCFWWSSSRGQQNSKCENFENTITQDSKVEVISCVVWQ